MYTNEHQTYTEEEMRTKTQFVGDAITKALEGMDEGTIQSIAYHIQTIRKRPQTPDAVVSTHNIVDYGWSIDHGLLTVRYGRSDIAVVDRPHDYGILLSWFADRRDAGAMTQVNVAVDPRAQQWPLVDVIESIEVDDGDACRDLLDWYVDACLSDDAQDVTDDEAGDME